MFFDKVLHKKDGHYKIIIKGAKTNSKESRELAKGLLMEVVYNDYRCHLITPINRLVVGTTITYSAEFDI